MAGPLGGRTFTQAFDEVRSQLNDIEGGVFTDAFLLSKGAEAWYEIHQQFRKHDIPFAEVIAAAGGTSGFDYAAAATTLTIGSTPAGVMYLPLEFWQRLSTSSPWQPMFFTDQLVPDPPAANLPVNLTYWMWDELALAVRVNAASQTKLIWGRYMRQPSYPAAATAVGFEEFYWPMVHRTAALAAGPTGRSSDASAQDQLYRETLETALIIAVKQQQQVPRSPAPVRGGRYPRGTGRGVFVT